MHHEEAHKKCWALLALIFFSQLGFITREALVILHTDAFIRTASTNAVYFYPGLFPNVVGAYLMGAFGAVDDTTDPP